eukprot:1305363-Lingulodinium_polyedra.AAC.1
MNLKVIGNVLDIDQCLIGHAFRNAWPLLPLCSAPGPHWSTKSGGKTSMECDVGLCAKTIQTAVGDDLIHGVVG